MWTWVSQCLNGYTSLTKYFLVGAWTCPEDGADLSATQTGIATATSKDQADEWDLDEPSKIAQLFGYKDTSTGDLNLLIPLICALISRNKPTVAIQREISCFYMYLLEAYNREIKLKHIYRIFTKQQWDKFPMCPPESREIFTQFLAVYYHGGTFYGLPIPAKKHLFTKLGYP